MRFDLKKKKKKKRVSSLIKLVVTVYLTRTSYISLLFFFPFKLSYVYIQCTLIKIK